MIPPDITRRLYGMVRIGTIQAVDHVAASPRVRVQDGELITDWLAVLTPRAGADRIAYPAPAVGEQVLVLAPGGDLKQGIVVGSLPSTAHPAPAQTAGIHRATYDDGAIIEYDRIAHTLKATLPAGAIARIEAPGGVTIVGDVVVQGKITATQVQAGTTLLTTHTHTAVTSGAEVSGPPAP